MPRFEYDPISLQRDLGRPDAAFFDDEMKRLALEAIDHYAVQIEQPIILHSDWTLDDTLTGFADRIAATLTSRETWRTYAIEAEVFARFLMARHGRRLADLREADLWEYRNRRLYGPLSERLSPNSWNKVAAVILRMLRHLKIHFSEVTWRSYCGTREADDQVKMVSLENYVTFRETGMMSGRNNLRNGAFSEMLVTTGIRCNEGSHILRQEIPKIGLFQDDITRIWSIPATVTNWEKGRDTFISKRVIKNFINPYIYEERSHVAAKIISERFPLKSYSPRTLTMSNNSIFFQLRRPGIAEVIAGDARKIEMPLANFTLRERERLIEVRPIGQPNRFKVVDFGSLWISEIGTCVSNSAWRSAFSAALARSGLEEQVGVDITPHVLRHTFAVYMLSFMLKGLVELRIARGHLNSRGEIYDALIGDPLQVLQELLGHRSIKTTFKYLRFSRKHSRMISLAFEAWDAHMALAA